MSGPRVARLDRPAPDAEPADVLDLGGVGPDPVATGGAAVASLGDVPVVPPATPVADLDAVGRAAAVRSAEPRDGGGSADLGAIGTAAPAPVRLARLDATGPDATGPGAARRGAPRPDAARPVAADPDAADPGVAGSRRARRPAREEAGGTPAAPVPPPGERDARSARTRRPPGPKQIDPDADPVAAAREICLRLLTDRARTRTELAQALARRGVPADAAGAVLERFDEVGLIDDAAFAGQWVRSRHRHRGLARRAIAQELRRKGVDDEVAGEALAEVDDGAEARRARELVDRRLRTMPAATPEQRASAARRLVGMLARKGYGAGVAYGVVKEALAEHGADDDELGGGPALD